MKSANGDSRAAQCWAIVPAAGQGTRFSSNVPKQYMPLLGQPMIRHTLERLAQHPRVAGFVVALSVRDRHWPGWIEVLGKPVIVCTGGAERARSVLAGLRALPPEVGPEDSVLVHDAARPCLRFDDLDHLLKQGLACADGAILAAPVRDTLKRGDDQRRIAQTVSRENIWRALTPQLFRRGLLTQALEDALAAGIAVTDEATAVERLGRHPLLVKGIADNIKVTDPTDLALAEFVLSRLPPVRTEGVKS